MQSRRDLRLRVVGEDKKARLGDLPDPAVGRWTPKRKARVVAALRCRELTVSEVCERYGLTVEELASWERAYDWGQTGGLTLSGMRQRRRTSPKADEG